MMDNVHRVNIEASKAYAEEDKKQAVRQAQDDFLPCHCLLKMFRINGLRDQVNSLMIFCVGRDVGLRLTRRTSSLVRRG